MIGGIAKYLKAASGYVGADDLVQYDNDGNIPGVVLHRKDVAAALDAVVLKDGELSILEDGSGAPIGIRLGDGTTEGGVALPGADTALSSSEFPTSTATTLSSTTLAKLNNTRLAFSAGETWQYSAMILAFNSGTGGDSGLGWEVRALDASDAVMDSVIIRAGGTVTRKAGFPPANMRSLYNGVHAAAMHAGESRDPSAASGYVTHLVTLAGQFYAPTAGFLYPMGRLVVLAGASFGAYATITGVKVSG